MLWVIMQKSEIATVLIIIGLIGLIQASAQQAGGQTHQEIHPTPLREANSLPSKWLSASLVG